MASVLLGLGSNLGQRDQTLRAAVDALEAHPGINQVLVSKSHQFAPIGGPEGQDEFINAAALIDTNLAPLQFLQLLQSIENNLGRQRDIRWDARTLDLDLLLFDDLVLNSNELILPHPRMTFRRFVLEPAAEIAADLIHPTTGWTIGRLLRHLREHPNYLAICGGSKDFRATLIERLGTELPLAVIKKEDTEDADDDLESALAHLQQRAKQIPLLGQSLEAETLVADFWIEQSWLDAKRILSPSDFSRFEQEFEQATAGRLAPKLLILVSGADSAEIAALQARATATDSGPWLIVDGSDPNTALQEASAAITAMR